MKKLLSLLVVLFCAFSLVACGGKNDDTVNIGMVGPFTGALATYGSTAKNGAMIAIEEINANGGILGKQIKVFVEDDQGEADQVLSAYNKVIDEIDFMFGEITSGNSEILAAQAQKDGVPTMSPSATAASVTQGRSYVFRTCFLDPDQGEAMAKFAKDTLKVASAVIVYDQSDDYSKGVAEAFKAKAENLGVTVKLYDGGLKAGESTYATLVETVKNADADCVFAPVYYEDVAVFAKELRAAGYTKPLLGADGYDGVLGQLAGTGDYSCVNNTFFSSHYSVSDEKVQEFIAKYVEKYGEEPAVFAALGYDAIYMIKQAMEEAGSTDKEAVKDALAAIDFKGGLTGDIVFDDNNNPIKTICVNEYVDGKMVLKEKITK